jgi:hypothetical protein
MKKKLLFLLLLILGFAVFLGVNSYIQGKKNESGRVKIVSSPAAGVFVDNVAMGRTPFEGKMKEGEYVVKLIPEGVSSDTVSWQGKVRVYKNALTYVNRELGSSDVSSAGETFTVVKMDKKPKNGNYGEIFVETEPAGAIVYLDNDEKGVSPLVMEEVLKGDHEISVFMPGFFRRTHKINVDGGYRTYTTFKLAIDQTQKKVEDLQKEAQTARDKEASESAQVTESSSSGTKIRIKDTPTGFLRVRQEPGTNGAEIAKVNPDESYPMVEETDGWFKIKLADGKEGWVSADYSEKESGSSDPTPTPEDE